MRLYTYLQRKIEKISSIDEYKFTVNSKQVAQLEDWVVAGITFPNFAKETQSSTLLIVYVYNFREGFKAVKLSVSPSQMDYQLALQFSAQKVEEGKQPQFGDSEAGEMFFTTVILEVNKFKQQLFSKEFNLFTLVEKIGWKSQKKQLNDEQKESKSIYYIIGGLIVGILTLGWNYLNKSRK